MNTLRVKPVQCRSYIIVSDGGTRLNIKKPNGLVSTDLGKIPFAEAEKKAFFYGITLLDIRSRQLA